MIPVLYLPNAADFSSFGLGVLTDTISCEVTEERNGVFECLLKYPVSGQHYGLITKECIIKAKPNDTAADQAFRIYRITKPLNGIVTIYGQHISYDLANVPVLPFSTDSRSPQLILSQLLAGDTRFTGWTDVDLTQEGVAEAVRAGELLRDEGFTFGKAYTSYLKRAVKTLDCVLDKLDEAWIPVEKSWRLNEKHYGMLQGLNKSETAEKYGEEQVHVWRRSYDVAPDPLPEDDPRNPRFDVRYACVPDAELPRTESLEQTIARILPYWHCVVFPSLMRYDSLLVVAHGNSLRGVIKHLKGIPDDRIAALNLPTAVPYVFEFDDALRLVRDYYLGDPEEIRRRAEAVARQGSAR